MNLDQRIERLSSAKRELLARRRRSAGAKTRVLSYAQQRLWFATRLEPENTAYNGVLAVRLIGPLDLPALEHALHQLADRHETLRTHIEEGDPEAVQKVQPAWHGVLERLELGPIDGGDADARVRSVLRAQALRAFDLTSGPLWRVALVREADDRHVLAITLHHIISDGWSSAILVRDLSRLYDARVRGGDAGLPPLPIQYGDYAVWQRRRLDGAALEEGLGYWRGALGGSVLLRLPHDRERPPVRSYGAGRLDLPLDPALVEGLRELGRRGGATLFMVLLAAWAVVLSRWAGRSDIVIGTDSANRHRRETEDLIGFFVNQLAFRIVVSPWHSVRTHVALVRKAAVDGYAHEEIPFERVVEALNPDRSVHDSPLFAVKMIVQQVPAVAHADGVQTLRVEPVPTGTYRTQVELLLSVADTASSTSASLVYDTDLYERDTATRLLTHWTRVLQAFVEDDSRCLGSLDVLSESETRQLLHESHGGEAVDVPGCVHHWLERRAREAPHRTALVAGALHVTRGALDRRATRLARYLVSLGVQPEVTVGICLGRSVDAIVAMVAVLKAGATYVPLDGSHPAGRLARQLESAAVAVVITDPSHRDRLPPTAGVLVDLDADQDAISECSTAALTSRATAANAAYILYTSGSTGTPKGVVITHRNLVNYIAWARRVYMVDAEVAAPLHTSFGFDLTVTSLWVPLSAGARVDLLPEGRPELLSGYLRAGGGPLLTKLTPTHLRGLGRPGVVEAVEDWTPPGGAVVIGGEALGTSDLAGWLGGDPRSSIFNEYGPTETTVGCCVYQSSGQEDRLQLPIGRAITGASVRVLHSGLGLAPAGAAGELHIGGAGVARGYVGRPDLTAARFLPDPYATIPGDRMYRSGDRARRLPDGNLEYLGRVDDQVKVRGYRVEPGEIEAALRQHPSVGDAAVIVSGGPGQGRLVAYWTPRLEVATPSDSALAQFLRTRLPEYMLPATYVEIPEIPVTRNGKVDRARLPLAEARVPPRAPAPPATPLEATLCAIWADVLKRDPVGVDDNFFELGGDSLLSLQVSARARKWRLNISVAQIFQEPTVRRLAAVLDAPGNIRTWPPGEGELPVAPIQQWLFEQEPRNPNHWNHSVLLSTPNLRVDALQRAVTELVRQHDALRLRFERAADGRWRQWYADSDAVGGLLMHVDLRALAAAPRWRAAVQACGSQVQASLHLGRGPVMRIVWFRTSDGDGRLLLVLHHLVVDGVSWRILLQDLQQWYTAVAAGSQPVVEPRTTSYGEWAHELQAQVGAEWLRREADYWAAMVDRGRGWRVLADRRPGDTGGRVESVHVSLTHGETLALTGVAGGADGARVQDVLLAAVVRSLAPVQHAGGVMLDLDGHGRHPVPGGTVDLSRTVGWFTSIYPVAVPVTRGETAERTLGTVIEQQRALPSDGLGYGILVHLARDERLRAAPRSTISFNYLGQFDQVLTARGWTAAPEPHGDPIGRGEQRPYGLEIVGAVRGGRLQVRFDFTTTRVSVDVMEAVAASFQVELRALVRVANDRPRTRGEVAGAASEVPELPPLEREPGDAGGPLSFGQQRLWFLDQLRGSSREYNMPDALHLTGELHVPALRAALTTVLRRHDVLRTRYAAHAGVPVQLVDPPTRIEMPCEDMSALDESGRRRAVRAAMRREWRCAFDLERGPVLRVRLLRLGATEHVLLRTVHHIAGDLWSQAVLNRELRVLYDAYLAGRPDPLPPLPLQYADFARWQQRLVESGAMHASVEYWKRQLDGVPEILELPSDRPRPAVQTFAAGMCRCQLPAGSVAALRLMAASEHATTYMALLAPFAALLSRHGAGSDVVVGSPVANRHDTRLEPLVGLFVNNIAMRLRLQSHMTLRDLLRTVRSVAIEAYRHQHVPFEHIVDALAPARRLEATPVYQVIFAFQNAPREKAAMGAVGVQALPDAELQVHQDLEVHAWDDGAAISMAWCFNRDLFDEWRIQQMMRHYVRLLTALATDPERRVTEADLLTAEERHQIVSEWNETARPIPFRAVPAQFAEQVALTPDAIAVVAGTAALTYRTLDAASEALRQVLVGHGAAPERVVVLAVPRSAELVIATLAVLKSGAAYLPLDTDAPAPRLTALVSDSDPACIVASPAWADVLSGSGRPTLTVDAERVATLLSSSGPAGPAWTNRPSAHAAATAAYVIYTSGSTGAPKGVVVSHQSMSELLDAVERLAPRTAGDVGLLFHSMTSDFSVYELWGSLLTGGTLVVATSAETRAADELLALIERERVTVLGQTPSALYQTLAAEMERATPALLAPLRTILVGGEPLEADRLRAWAHHRVVACPPSVFNMYGPTEVTVWAAAHPVTPADWAVVAPPVVTLGRPLSRYRIHLLDASFRPVPVGIAAEVYIAGAGLARGYRQRPGLTAERFLPDEAATAPGSRLYRTGDRARWRPDGRIEFLGRVDDQIKLRAYRIEPREVEAAILREGAREAAVVVREDTPGDRKLVAYVVATAFGSSVRDLRTRLRAVLPDHLVPSLIVPMDRLPFTSTGKLDRKALPKPDAAVLHDTADAPPDARDSTEVHLTCIWEEVLGVTGIGIRDDFFRVGGHSLNSIALTSKISRLYGRPVPAGSLFRYPTIEQYAAFLRRDVAVTPSTSIVPIQPRGGRAPLFLVHPAGGLGHVYMALARTLGADQPLFAFESRGFDPHGRIHTRIEDMAADYVRDLRAFHADGPYLLGGWSMGGMVAYEMARQLVAAGGTVALLALLDTGVPPVRSAARGGRTADDRAGGSGRPDTAVTAAQARRLTRLLQALKQSNQLPDDITVDQLRRYRQVFASNIHSERRYVPGPFSGTVTLFNARASAGDSSRGWDRLAGGGTVVRTIEGPHHRLVFEPHVKGVADALRESLDSVTR